MNKRTYLLLFSIFFNAILIFVLVGKLGKPTVKELSDINQDSRTANEISRTNPEVIGKKTEKEILAKVAKVIDGDTIVLSSGETVRYIGVDAPETVRGENCFSDESTNKNKELVLGKQIRLEKDISEIDRYKRLLRYIWVGDVFVNEVLVREGYSLASTYPPDVKYSELFKEAESHAREESRGLWGECKGEVSPFRLKK